MEYDKQASDVKPGEENVKPGADKTLTMKLGGI